MTLSRCVVISKAASAAGSNPGKSRLTLDHCDIVANGATDGGAILKNAAGSNINLLLTVKNSNLYSSATLAVNLTLVGSDQFVSDYNNVRGAVANLGYTPGVHDVSLDPGYTNINAIDLRYSNNTLKRADSAGGPIGVNAGYGNVVAGIVPGTGAVNRAHGWTSLK